MAKCTYIDGIGSSQAIDTAGEIVDLNGLDCSMLIGGAFNWEHKSDVPAQLVGKILDYKKIFTEADCDNERHRKYWNKCQVPFLYVMGRLRDDKNESAKEVAGHFLDDAEHPEEPPSVGFSIEGAKIAKEGMVITRSIARKVTITNQPANKTCAAEMIPAKKVSKNDPDSLFKGEVEFFNPNAEYLEFLEKRENDMQLQKSAPQWSPWKQAAGGIHSSHPEYGTVSITKHPSGTGFQTSHAGKPTAINGKPSGAHATPEAAAAHAKEYQAHVSSTKGQFSPTLHNRTSPNMPGMRKALEAGSSNVAPSELTQGAALGKEDLAGKKKSKWLKRAEEAYSTWEKREEFQNFMKKHMPHLTKGEIDAFGKVLALKKTMVAEESLAKMFASHFSKTTDIMMASDEEKENG